MVRNTSSINPIFRNDPNSAGPPSFSGSKNAHRYSKKAVLTFHSTYPAVGCTIATNAADARATLADKID